MDGKCLATTLWDYGNTRCFVETTSNSSYVFVTHGALCSTPLQVTAVTKTGSGTITLESGAGANVLGITTDDTTVFWGVQGSPSAIIAAPPDGSGAPLPRHSTNVDPVRLTSDATNLYWSDGTDVVMRPKTGGSETSLAPGEQQVGHMMVAGSHLYFVAYDAACGGGSGCPVVRRVPLGGGSSETVSTAVDAATRFATDGTFVYWADARAAPNGKLVRYPLPNGPESPIAAADSPGGIAVDANGVYWVNGSTLFEVPKDGSAVPFELGLSPTFTQMNVVVDVDAAGVYATHLGNLNYRHVFRVDK